MSKIQEWFSDLRIRRIAKEIANYFFWLRVIRQNRMTPTWKKFNLRQGWFGIVYTVINLPPEVYESEEMYHQVYVVEELKPLLSYLAEKNTSEIIRVTREQVPQPKQPADAEKKEYVAAFLIKFIPIFNDFTIGWIFKWSIIIGGFFWLQSKFDIISMAGTALRWIQSVL